MSPVIRMGTNDPIEGRRVDSPAAACFFRGLPITIHAGILTPEFKETCTKPACSGLSLEGTMERS
jgi:hypothetical protein